MSSLIKGPVAQSLDSVYRGGGGFYKGDARIADLMLDPFELEEFAIALKETCGAEISGEEIAGISTLEKLAMRVDPEGSIVR